MRRFQLVLSILAIALAGCAPEGPTAFVDLNLPVDSACQVDLGGTDVVAYLPSGLYDIASRHSNSSEGDFCARDYNTHLRINSFLRPNSDRDLGRAEPNILQVHSAEVTLRSQDDAVLDFAGALPNPFRLITGVSLFPSPNDEPSIASITIKTIPAAYAEYLDIFADQTVVADIQLFGTTTGDVDVDFKIFPYPIQICNGCLTGCASVFTSAMATESREQLIGEFCDDNGGQDGRVCYDDAC